MRVRAGLLGVVGLVLAGCGGGPHSTNVADTPPSVVTSTSVDPAFVVPASIDAAYVEQVLRVLDHVQGDVVRSVVASGAFGPHEVAPLRAVFNDPELSGQVQGFAGLVEVLDRFQRPPGDNRSEVVRLLTARPDCIYAETSVDISATVVDAPPPFRRYVALRPSQPDTDPQDRNPTPFSIAAQHSQAADPCG